jgi:hypothetical protein
MPVERTIMREVREVLRLKFVDSTSDTWTAAAPRAVAVIKADDHC